MLKQSLRRLRSVKSHPPPTADSVEFADWREEVAGALEALACVLAFEADRVRAGAEAAAAREHAAEIRRRSTEHPSASSPLAPVAAGGMRERQLCRSQPFADHGDQDSGLEADR
ncbi:hypothetical protein ACH5A7_18240 [Streptomyces sp. NPDC018955]|uniref:hypothetical protein n=1 Tax=Streptomyces sp. NPDC018955 TaxID=3365055 RepID=UPI00378A9371